MPQRATVILHILQFDHQPAAGQLPLKIKAKLHRLIFRGVTGQAARLHLWIIRLEFAVNQPDRDQACLLILLMRHRQLEASPAVGGPQIAWRQFKLSRHFLAGLHIA